MKRMVWALVSVAALALLVFLALHGPDRRQLLVEHQAEGTMQHLTTDSVNNVRITSGSFTGSFSRGPHGQWSQTGATVDATTAANASAAIEAGLRLLHNTVPERSFETEAAEFGLSAPVLQVTVKAVGDQTFEAIFGATNPIGLARYVRIRSAGLTTVHLMPSYMVDAWTPALPGTAR
ncbi:hypothetical protein [Rhodoferax sp.]|uniref:hypothetical protein n=1 Tax=Rhodoferax sp. TaxID=50421 RepID=UPI001EBE2EF8|nr:hypothetical protein [Rhodoferax sp.]MBT9508189.1 hypothetical protein [Rhodoferax sp.]